MNASDQGVREKAQKKFEELCLSVTSREAEPDRRSLSLAIVGALGPGTPRETRRWLLRQLERIAGEEAVEGVAGLLTDPDPVVRERARRALAADPAEGAGRKLRDALEKAEDPQRRAALIDALAYRRDLRSEERFIRFLADGNRLVVLAAIRALGTLGTSRAAAELKAKLEKSSPSEALPVLDALLRGAEAALRRGEKEEARKIYESLHASRFPLQIRKAALRGLKAVSKK